MNTVRTNGKKMLAVVLGAVMLSGAVPAALSQAITNQCCNKNLGRGGGYPVAIYVMLAGKPAASAVITINTLHGVPVKSVKASSLGVANTKLSPGDYIVTAKTKSASGMSKIMVTATTPVTVTVTLTPST
jgi:hypothetical protein